MSDFCTADQFNPNKPFTLGDIDNAISVLDAGKPKDAPVGSDRPHSDDSRRVIKELDDLLIEEKFIIQQAIMRSKSCVDVRQDRYFVNLPTLSHAYHKLKCNQGKKYETIDQLIRRRAFFLANRGIATVEKGPDGLTWVFISREALAKLADETRRRMEADRNSNIDLIRSLCKIPTTPEKPKKRTSADIPRNATNERLTAIKLALGIKGMMNNVDRAEFSHYFDRYNDRVTEKIIALLDNRTGELIGSEYSTRFNDTKKAAIALTKFDYVIEQSLKDYFRASLLTLTTDPKRYTSLWEANRSLGIAWNRFMSWLTKKNKKTRPEYIAAYEYTKSGLIHVHAIIFMPWVADKKEITKEWEKIGHGTINDVRGLKRQNIKGEYVWKWSKKRPYGSTAAHGGDYLKKYLKKAYLAKTDRYDDQSSVQALYWVFNKRFWSSSQRLLPPPGYFDLPQDAKEEPQDEVATESAFSFFKILNSNEYDRSEAEVGDILVTEEGYDVRMIYKRDSRAERERRDDGEEVEA